MDTANHISDLQGTTSETDATFSQRELCHDSANHERRHAGELTTTKIRKKKRKRKVSAETGFNPETVATSGLVPPQSVNENALIEDAEPTGRADQHTESMLFHVHTPFPTEDSQIGNASDVGSQSTTFLPGMVSTVCKTVHFHLRMISSPGLPTSLSTISTRIHLCVISIYPPCRAASPPASAVLFTTRHHTSRVFI
jgi:hypothetical protein